MPAASCLWQVLGGNGYTNDYPTGRILRDAKLYEIGAGQCVVRASCSAVPLSPTLDPSAPVIAHSTLCRMLPLPSHHTGTSEIRRMLIGRELFKLVEGASGM
jgi:alkylation response protein AidB-like acyl-CoA dehydrogenase